MRAWVASLSWSHLPPFSGGTAVVVTATSSSACLLGSTWAYRRIRVQPAATHVVIDTAGSLCPDQGVMSQLQRFDSQYEGPFPSPPAAEPFAADGQPDRPTPVEIGTKPVHRQGPRVATLILMVGLPAAGKTTRARELAAAHQALRLTPDHWMIPLFGDSMADGRRFVLVHWPSWSEP